MKSRYSLLILLLFSATFAMAGNVQVSNATLGNQNLTNETYKVIFDISWENSWRTSTFESNYDAAWIFVKWRLNENQVWKHANLKVNGSTAPVGGIVNIPDDGTGYGAFLYRDVDGIGNVNFSDVKLLWDYGSNGVADDAIVEICVLAIEMVYIPGGGFEVGDDSANPMGNLEAGSSGNPFSINSEAAINLGGTSTLNLSNNNAVVMATPDDFNYTTTQVLPAAYPKGTNPFYIMKYEMSQGQYAAFLNKLNEAASANRFPGQEGNNNHTLSDAGVPPNTYVAASPDRACNFLNYSDLAAYADWSGLRPMSELEYEKACRGTLPASVDECAWGNPFAFNQDYVVANNGQPNSFVNNPANGTGNALYGATRPGGATGPMRCGIFAASILNPSRAEAGATYYGVMEMSGNNWELVIVMGAPQGRNFNGAVHGNGIIGINSGDSTVGSAWPAISGATEAAGACLRGGGSPNSITDLRTSSRRLGNFKVTSRFSDVGGRLVRSKL